MTRELAVIGVELDPTWLARVCQSSVRDAINRQNTSGGISSAASVSALTTGQLAARTKTPTDQLLPLLDELAEAGLVEARGSGWALTAGAEAKFGRAFRDIRLDGP